VWENTNPNFATALNVARHSLTGGLYLATGNTFVTLCLQSKLAVRNVVAGCSHAANFALTNFAELGAFWQ
jgi:hypothetical protein